MNGITERQRVVLRYIEETIREHGAPPTVREIARALKFKSHMAASCHLAALEKKGFISRRPGLARNIKILRAAA